MIANRIKGLRAVATVVAAMLAAVSVASCGGSHGASGDTVAQIAGTAITRATLNHWMSTIIGGDFYELTGKVAPTGLVSEPPHYTACVTVLEGYEAAPRPGNAAGAPAALRHKCEQLYRAIKQQTVAYLITADVAVGEGAEQGLTVNSSEIEQAFKRIQAVQFPTETALSQYLADRHWTLKDELYLVKRDLLSQKLTTKLKRKFNSAGGEQALAGYIRETRRRWTAKTTCRPGYVVPGCRQYDSQKATASSSDPSPSALIEELAVGARSTAAAAKSVPESK